MAQRATSLGPKPSLFSFCYCLFLVFVFFSLLSFLGFFEQTKIPVFPLKKGTLCLFFSVSLCFSLAFFVLPPFLPFLFLCLSLLFFSFFLPVFHFLVLALVFSFCCVCFFLFQDVLLFLFFCLLSSVVLNHNISFLFALHLVFLLLLFFCLACFVFGIFWFWETNQKHP